MKKRTITAPYASSSKLAKLEQASKSVQPFFKAIALNDINLVLTTLSYYDSAFANPSEGMHNLMEVTLNGMTPLHYAIQSKSNLKMVNLLIEQGANINSVDSQENSMLHLAARMGEIDIVDFFIKLGLGINKSNKEGRTPLDSALMGFAQLPTITLLIKNGGLTTLNPYKGTNLHIAASASRIDLIEYFLKDGADINARDDKGLTPLHIAVSTGRLDLVIKLSKLGADINAQDKEGRTPLYMTDKSFLAESLLELGANINAKDKGGFTPIARAYQIKSLEMFIFFAKKGAQLSLKSIKTHPSEINEALGAAQEVDNLFKPGWKVNHKLLLKYNNNCIKTRIASLAEKYMEGGSYPPVKNMVNILRKINATQPDNKQLRFPKFDDVEAKVDQYIIIKTLKSLYSLEKWGTTLWSCLPKEIQWVIIKEFMNDFNPKVVEGIIEKKVAHKEKLDLAKDLKRSAELLTNEQGGLLKDYNERLEEQKKSLEEAALLSELTITLNPVKPEEEAEEMFFGEEGNGPIASGMSWEPGPFPW